MDPNILNQLVFHKGMFHLQSHSEHTAATHSEHTAADNAPVYPVIVVKQETPDAVSKLLPLPHLPDKTGE